MKVKNRLIKPEQPLNLQNLPRFDHELDEGEDLQEDSCLGYVKKCSTKGSWYVFFKTGNFISHILYRYSCRDCALDFICKSCVKKCHTTHEFSLMSVKYHFYFHFLFVSIIYLPFQSCSMLLCHNWNVL